MSDGNDNSTVTSPDDDLVGKRLGRYDVLALVGKGGMGEVYRAEDSLLKRTVALKRIAAHLRANAEYRHLLIKEAERASQLNNERVAQIHDVLEQQGELFLIMEYVDGVSLRQRLGLPLPLPEFLDIAIQCSEALAAAHTIGITHRDIKPENIMITRAGVIKICDFGLARRISQAEHADSQPPDTAVTLRGTPAYMAPEALLGHETDARSDIFSMGIVLYEALTGKHPFRVHNNHVATVDSILHAPVPAIHDLHPSVPEPVTSVVEKALSKDPSRRYANAADLAADLSGMRARLQDNELNERGERFWSPLRVVLVVGFAMLLAVLSGLWILRKQTFDRTASVVKTLVILPFHFTGSGNENQAYTDGLIETVAAKLGKAAGEQIQIVPVAEVRSRHSTTPADALAEFSGTWALQGGVQQSGNIVRINYALIDTKTGRQLGSDSITLAGEDPFLAQDSVFSSVSLLLGLHPAPDLGSLASRYGTRLAGAYDFYLQGRGYLQNYDRPENLESAISVFNQALSIDPQYGLAFAGIGEAYWKKFESTKDQKWVPLARSNCEEALKFAPDNSDSNNCLATVESGTGQYEQAVSRFQKAIEIDHAEDSSYTGLATAYDR